METPSGESTPKVAQPVADQLTKLTEMLVEQQQFMKEMKEQMQKEAEETEKVKKEMEKLHSNFAGLSVAPPGGGDANAGSSARTPRSVPAAPTGDANPNAAGDGGGGNGGGGGGGAGGGGGGAGGGGGGARGGPVVYDIHRVRLDVCPKALKDQAMREWTDFTKEWLKSAPDVLFHGEGRYRLHNAITMALELKPRVKTTWLRLLQDADRERKAKGDWQEPLDAVLDNLKEMVVAEELVVANEEFKARDMQSGETYSEYKMGLYSIGGVAYESYSYEQLTEKVLDRFLLGCGEAGPSVRLQAPKDLEEAIAKAIAYDNEKARNEGGKEEKTVFAFKQGGYQQNRNGGKPRAPFQGSCFNCGKKGHKSDECWSKKPQQPQQPQQKSDKAGEIQCFRCEQNGHKAVDCPDRKKQ